MSQHQKLSNKEVVQILKEALAAMEVKNLNRFELRAYQNAISVIDNLTSSVYDLWENRRLGEIPGVGKSLEAHLDELFTTGRVGKFEALQKDLPQGMFSLIGIRGIGAKKAFKLAASFGLIERTTALEKIKELAEAHKIQVLEGFGEKSEQDILAAVSAEKMTKREKTRLLLIHAEDIALRIIDHMQKCSDVLLVEALGSLRRRNATVGDLDLAAATKNSAGTIAHFLQFPEIEEVISQGEKKLQVVLKNDVQVDFRTIVPEAFGAMVQYFTGSKQHNVLLRTYALEMGLSLSEYGIKQSGKLLEFATEEDFYKKLKLDYIAPELRHGKNEIELAKAHKLPKLIELKDIHGDIHTHTNASDGTNTLAEMVQMAYSIGYEYYGVADHAPSVQSRGFAEVEKIVDARRKEIDKINAQLEKDAAEDGKKPMKVLFGYEVNILADATLAMPDRLLAKLDYVIASIHTSFDQSREKVTERLIKTLENPYATIIGHPSGRLINERDACDIDWRQVFVACRASNKILEINSQPSRLDLADDLVKDAIDTGVQLIINTDAHTATDLHLMKYGIDVARRGFCEKQQVVNTLSVPDFLAALARNNRK